MNYEDNEDKSAFPWGWLLVFGLLFGVLAVAAMLFPAAPEWTGETKPAKTLVARQAPGAPAAITPVPEARGLDEVAVALGERLFQEPMLSADDTLSCAHCHDLGAAGVDHLPHSVGIGGAVGLVNAPTVFNARFNFKQFWDGRANSLEDQVDGPLHDPREMGTTWPQVLEKLQPVYGAEFERHFDGGLTPDNIKFSLAEFQRSLVTPNSRFDRYLKGENEALDARERTGYELFLGLGCVKCHQGVGIGGNMFQRMGAKNNYFRDRGNLTKADLGRYNVTGEEFDRFRFKVPSLRNVARTAPYFHDGSAATLKQAVATMARYQLARTLSAQELNLLVAFLQTLTGEYRGRSL